MKSNPKDFDKSKTAPSATIGKPFARKIPAEFDKKTIETIRSQKKKAKREWSPNAGELMSTKIGDMNTRFNLKPANSQVCRKHRQTPIEFFNPISNTFICKICASEDPNQKMVPLFKAAAEF